MIDKEVTSIAIQNINLCNLISRFKILKILLPYVRSNL